MLRATVVGLVLAALIGRAAAAPDDAPAVRLGAAYAAYEAGDLDAARRALDGLAPERLANPDYLRWVRGQVALKGDDPAKHPDLYEREGSVTLSVLPGDRLSVSTPAEARAEDRELAGIYAWP